MPADNKNANAKLVASAKEFVPTSSLKANASAWKPAVSSNNSSTKSKSAAKAAAGGENKAPKSAVDAVKKQSGAAAPASAWGSKKSDAIKKAPAQQSPTNQNAQPRQHSSNQHRGSRGGKGQGRNQGDRNNSNYGRDRQGNYGRNGRDDNGRDGGRRQSHQQDQRRQYSSNRAGDVNDDAGPHGDSNWSRGKVLPTELLKPGEGGDDAQKAVKRIDANDLLAMRINFMDAPEAWGDEDNANRPPEIIRWVSETRLAEIKASSDAGRIGGDVSKPEKKKNKHDTAPALEDCKPLEVNDDTRWKAKVFKGEGGAESGEGDEGKDEILRKAMLILNKLSLTKFDKLSNAFIDCGIGRDIDCLTGAVEMIVTKAQEEQHFASMYASLCLKLASTPMEGIDEGSKKGKKFKKILLERCQTEFEKDAATKIAEATEGITDKDLIEYHSTLIKKHYLGHMRFIGELYKCDLLSIKIILFCLPSLLKGDSEHSDEVDEEKVECFSKLMTVIGSSLEQQSEAMASVGKKDAADNLRSCWKTVEIMAGRRKEEGPKVSNRIKFMLQDLLEMKSKGWVTRRKEETAKTIAEIHKDIAKEERAAKRNSVSKGGKGKTSLRRGASSGDVRNLDKQQQEPQVDADGFVSIPKSAKNFNRSASMSAMSHSQTQKEGGYQKYSTRGSTVNLNGMTKSSSQSKFAVLNEKKPVRKTKSRGSGVPAIENSEATSPPESTKPKINYPTPDQCGEKAKNILQEFFVGGDLEDAVLSIHELIGVGDEGSVDRGAKVVEGAVLKVVEMKQEHVDKFLEVFLRCASEKKIEGDSFVMGLNDPLEFLSDIAIDAPLATPLLAGIIAELVKAEHILISFLLNSPEYFRTDGQAAAFAAKILARLGDDAAKSAGNIDVVDKLMTEEDRSKYSQAHDLIASEVTKQ